MRPKVASRGSAISLELRLEFEAAPQIYYRHAHAAVLQTLLVIPKSRTRDDGFHKFRVDSLLGATKHSTMLIAT